MSMADTIPLSGESIDHYVLWAYTNTGTESQMTQKWLIARPGADVAFLSS